MSGPPKLLLGYDSQVAQWVAQQLGTSGFWAPSAIGIIKNDSLIAGVVYHDYRQPSIEMCIASTSPAWCTKTVLKHLFDYPFNQLQCKRITALVDADNKQVRKFDERLGFKLEGILREAHPNGDAAIYGMLKTDCRWI